MRIIKCVSAGGFFSSFFDFFEGVFSSAVYSRASFDLFVPGIGACEIGFPERPGSALGGSDGVDQTVSAVVVSLEEDAVVVSVFD